jgi:hypothetical protein
MFGFGAIGQFAIGEVGFPGETVTVDKWFQALSEPVRFPRGLKAAQQPFFFFDPQPFVPFSWFEALSEPPRFPRRLPASEQQFQAYSPNPLTIIPFNWFEALSEPPRFPVGLKASLKQFLAHPPQLRPIPGTSARMAAIDTKDLFLGGARVFLRVDNAEIGVIEMMFTGSQIGIVEMPASIGTSGVIENALAPASGSPVASITTAHVSIRIL